MTTAGFVLTSASPPSIETMSETAISEDYSQGDIATGFIVVSVDPDVVIRGAKGNAATLVPAFGTALEVPVARHDCVAHSKYAWNISAPQ